MVKSLEIYKCDTCGNIVEVIDSGDGELVCCGEPMKRLSENTVDAAKEKHVPVIVVMDSGVRVTVGETLHPMEEGHYIKWIELIADGKVYRQLLEPGTIPEAFFAVFHATELMAREYCNLHGLWKTTVGISSAQI